MKLTPTMNFEIECGIENSMDECGSCGSYHPRDYEGDCRNDDYRYHPDDMKTLLEAAPDLLEACRLGRNIAKWAADVRNAPTELQADIEIINAAIAKAKGE